MAEQRTEMTLPCMSHTCQRLVSPGKFAPLPCIMPSFGVLSTEVFAFFTLLIFL